MTFVGRYFQHSLWKCVVCLSSKATMQTFPCGHKVVCRKCFVKTIQVAVSQRCLPLKCVVCRTRILKLKQLGEDTFTPPLGRRHGSPGRPGGRLPKPASLARQLFSSKHSPPPPAAPAPPPAASPAAAARPQPVVTTKLMQPWLIYPSQNSPKQQRAFGADHPLGAGGGGGGGASGGGAAGGGTPRHHRAGAVHPDPSSPARGATAATAAPPKHRPCPPPHAGPFSPSQRRPRHQCSHAALSRLAELKHAHMLSPRIPRCSKCAPAAPPTRRGVLEGV